MGLGRLSRYLGAAEAPGAALRNLGRQQRAGLPHAMFPSPMRPVAAVLVTVGLGDLRLDLLPGGAEGLAGGLKALRGPAGTDAPVRGRIERDRPLPLIDMNR